MQDLVKHASKSNGRWTKEEHLKFLQGLRIYGKNWKKIEQLIETRTGSQIRSHAQKFFLKIKQPEEFDGGSNDGGSGEMEGEVEDMTMISKWKWSTERSEGDFSFFLEKIIEYSVMAGGDDFWGALVDVKLATDNQSKVKRNGSFSNYEEDSNSLETISNHNKNAKTGVL